MPVSLRQCLLRTLFCLWRKHEIYFLYYYSKNNVPTHSFVCVFTYKEDVSSSFECVVGTQPSRIIIYKNHFNKHDCLHYIIATQLNTAHITQVYAHLTAPKWLMIVTRHTHTSISPKKKTVIKNVFSRTKLSAVYHNISLKFWTTCGLFGLILWHLRYLHLNCAYIWAAIKFCGLIIIGGLLINTIRPYGNYIVY